MEPYIETPYEVYECKTCEGQFWLTRDDDTDNCYSEFCGGELVKLFMERKQ